MALRLRRGTNAERTTQTFAVGELVYTTDTKQLYVGDGATTGGLLVSSSSATSPAALTRDLSLAGFNITGTGDITATSFTGDGSGLTNLPGGGTGVVDGQDYVINIQGDVIGDDTTVIVDATLGRVTADLYGDGSNITNQTLQQLSNVNITSPVTNQVLKYDGADWVNGVDAGTAITVKDEGVALATAVTTFDFVGDGVTVSGTGTEKTVTIPGAVGGGGEGIIEGQTYRIDINGDIIADDSTIMVNSFNNTITASAGFFGDLVGNVTGDVVGSLKGSIFGDDSAIVYDSAADSLSVFRAEMSVLETRDISPETGFTAVTFSPRTGETANKIILSATDSTPSMDIQLESASDLSASDNFVGAINFKIDDSNPALAYGGINMRKSRLTFVNDASGAFADAKSMVLADGQVGIGTVAPSATLDVQGDISATGSLFVSTIDTDDSSAITITPAVTISSDLTVENDLVVTNTVTADRFISTGTETPEISASANLNLTAGNAVVVTNSPLRMASFTTTERNALAAQNGDIIYNTTDNKFQGYENGAWANLI